MSVPDIVFPVKAIQCARGAKQIAPVIQRVQDSVLQNTALLRCFRQHQYGCLGSDCQRAGLFCCTEGYRRQIPIPNALRGAVVEGVGRVGFNTEETVGQNRNTKIPPKELLPGGTFRCRRKDGVHDGTFLSVNAIGYHIYYTEKYVPCRYTIFMA